MDCLKIIEKIYAANTSALAIIVNHGTCVAQKALSIADRLEHLNPDRNFIYESAMLHDIGLLHTHAPALGISGKHPYILHGILGRFMLENLKLYRHAMVCERHIGVGLTMEDIKEQKLPLPLRDMIPTCLEEKIVCYADKFFSKSPSNTREKTPQEILENLACYGQNKVSKFLRWMSQFGP